MPLTSLVDYFNDRIIHEQGLADPPLEIRDGRVEGHFGDMRLATVFDPIRRADKPELIAGHDASLQAYRPDQRSTLAEQVFAGTDAAHVVSLDRLCRTIHMLNYLPDAHQEGSLFLTVHPRHVLGVKRDHGAYFEEVIFRCGLTARRVVITVPVTPVYDRQLNILLQGLRNYQQRGYSTAIRFDDSATEGFLERYFIEFLYRITPDFVRIPKALFASLVPDESSNRRTTNLLSVIHSLDTELLLEGIDEARDADLAKLLRADLIKGPFLEDGQERKIA